MRKTTTIALASGFLAALSAAAYAQSMDYPAAPEQPTVVEPSVVPPAGDIMSGPVRIIPLDPLLVQNGASEIEKRQRSQAEVSSDPVLLSALESAGLSVGDVVDVGTDVDGQTTIYVRG